MNIRATPTTAALAGIFSGIAWPLLSPHVSGSAATGSLGYVMAALLVLAVPAHAFVLGFGPQRPAGAAGVDMALLRRIGAWLLGAGVALAVVTVSRAA